ncbi:hypothetical protein MNR02_06400 [Shinella sp. H4-D48]|uniref:hypothetical protein n=1 Tax=Shinella sp. H4-D48 TaxID=2925841 RepID=UPI001F53860E|nr:hypothetical protein [Shinella sp. H4-D48]UNK39331.1 hypothetical protein MNR02_06400 [Shinella sp. H4-D48]
MSNLSSLIARLEKATSGSNELDVAIEIALSRPGVSVRPNASGTKLIYATRSGKESTHWAGDHTLTPERRAKSLSLLRALDQKGSSNG